LLPAFIRSLQTWKAQSISFLNLPPEVRNRIFQLASEDRHPYHGDRIRLGEFYPWMSPCWERGALMHSCKQVRNEFMPLYITSSSFLLHLGYDEGQTGFETVAWLKEACPALTSHVRQLQVNFGVSWSDESRTAFVPSNVKLAASVIDIAGLHIEVSHGGHLRISLAYDTKVDERALHDIEEKVGQSLKDGSTGLMGFVEFMIMYEVLQQYHPGVVYNRSI
jgi:hypothetical protein